MPIRGAADDLCSGRMSRVRAALVLFVAIGVAALGSLAAAGTVGATTPPGPPTPATTVPAGVAPPAAPVATTVPPAGSRGGATDGSVVKPGHETWDAQRIIVT